MEHDSSAWSLCHDGQESPLADQAPPVNFSVIVPVRDDAPALDVALSGLRQQLHPPDEVIIVNAGAQPLARPMDVTLPLRIVEAGPSLPGRARNEGAKAARSEMLVFLDAGTRPVPGWLDSFRRAARETPDTQVIYGCFVPNLRNEWDCAAAGVYLPARVSPHVGSWPTAASLCIRRELWANTGGMPENLRAGEDLIFIRELQTRGVRAVHAADARVVWDLPSNACGHYRRLRRYSAATWTTDLARQWQWPVIRMYAAGAAALTILPVLHWSLLAVPPFLAVLRVARNYGRRRPGLSWRLTTGRALRLVAMTALVDAATFSGIWDAFCQRAPRRSPEIEAAGRSDIGR
jgi:hypothetical protein